jgi:hypothetical protein
MNRTECLEAAAGAVADREGKYGTPLENHTRTAAMWSVILGVEVTAAQVCMCNAAQKLSRLCCDPAHMDSWVDVAGSLLPTARRLHRATADVEALIEIVKWYKKEGHLA